MVGPSIFQLPPAIIEEAKKAKDPEWQIERACFDLRTKIMLTTISRLILLEFLWNV
jgi:hypothetical protein